MIDCIGLSIQRNSVHGSQAGSYACFAQWQKYGATDGAAATADVEVANWAIMILCGPRAKISCFSFTPSCP